MTLRHFLLSQKEKRVGLLGPLPLVELIPAPETDTWMPDSGPQRVVPSIVPPDERRAVRELLATVKAGFVFWFTPDVRVRIEHQDGFLSLQLEVRRLEGSDLFRRDGVEVEALFSEVESLFQEAMNKALSDGGRLLTHGREVVADEKFIN